MSDAIKCKCGRGYASEVDRRCKFCREELISRSHRRRDMKTPTLTQIRHHVEASGGTYKKLKMYLNGNDAYEVNGVTMTKADMIERFNGGAL